MAVPKLSKEAFTYGIDENTIFTIVVVFISMCLTLYKVPHTY